MISGSWDSTYFEIDASDDAILNYDSISAKLDTDLPLSDQLEYVPSGVMLILFVVNADNVVVQNTVAWGYTKDYCDVEPLSVGDDIGCIELEGYAPPFAKYYKVVTKSPTGATPEAPPIEPATVQPTVESPSLDDRAGTKANKINYLHQNLPNCLVRSYPWSAIFKSNTETPVWKPRVRQRETPTSDRTQCQRNHIDPWDAH